MVARPLPWIVSPRFDGAFFIGSVAVPLALWAGFQFGFWSGVALYVLFQLAFNLPHHMQTWSMSFADRDTRTAQGRRFIAWGATVALALGLPMWLSPDHLYPVVRDGLIYWGYFHLVRQHQGFVKIYERKAGGLGPLETQVWARFVDVVSYAPLLLRFTRPGWMTLSVAGRQSEVWHPWVSPAWASSLWALYFAVIGVAAVRLWVEARSQKASVVPRALYLLTVTASFGLTVLGVQDFITAVAMVTALHNVQYAGLTWFHNRSRLEEGASGGNGMLRLLAQRRFLAYTALVFGYGVVLLAPRALWPQLKLAELPLSWAVAMHYVVDAGLWRMKRHPERARWLGLSAPKVAS